MREMKRYIPETLTEDFYEVKTYATGSAGSLPLQPDFLRDGPSGHIFGWTQDAAMGWNPSDLGKDEFLILSTQGGIRAEDGSPIALGYHTGHYEGGLLAQAVAKEFKEHNDLPPVFVPLRKLVQVVESVQVGEMKIENKVRD
jgi:hypothetical protein